MGPNYSGYGYYGEQKKKFPLKPVLLIGGGVIVVLVIIGIIGGILGQNTIAAQSQHLSARLANLTAITTAAGTQLSNGDLKKINAETALITDGVDADLASILPQKVDKAVQTAEADTSDTTKLANAALAGTYDSVYQQVLQQQLQSIDALLQEMTAKTKSAILGQTLSRDDQNYQALLTSLSKITL